MEEALGINLPGLLTHLISFVILVGLLTYLLYKPLLSLIHI